MLYFLHRKRINGGQRGPASNTDIHLRRVDGTRTLRQEDRVRRLLPEDAGDDVTIDVWPVWGDPDRTQPDRSADRHVPKDGLRRAAQLIRFILRGPALALLLMQCPHAHAAGGTAFMTTPLPNNCVACTGIWVTDGKPDPSVHDCLQEQGFWPCTRLTVIPPDAPAPATGTGTWGVQLANPPPAPLPWCKDAKPLQVCVKDMP